MIDRNGREIGLDGDRIKKDWRREKGEKKEKVVIKWVEREINEEFKVVDVKRIDNEFYN